MRPCRVERVRHVLLHAGNARRAHEIALRCTNDFQRGHCRSLCCSRRSPRARPVWRSLLTAPRALPGGGTQPIAPQGADRRGLPTSASPDPKTGTSPDARRAPTYHAATVLAAGMLARLRRAWYSNAFAPHPALSEVASRCPDVAHVWFGRLARPWCDDGVARFRRVSPREPTFAGAGLTHLKLQRAVAGSVRDRVVWRAVGRPLHVPPRLGLVVGRLSFCLEVFA